MRIWVDLTSPPHVAFFRAFLRALDPRTTLVTARDFGGLPELLARARLRHRLVGRHGGANRLGKLRRSAERTAALAGIVAAWRPDVAVAKHSVELARVAYGLGLPSLTVLDHETATLQNRLILPLTDVVLAPAAVSAAALRRQGARRVRQFAGVCEAAHFLDFRPAPLGAALAGSGLALDPRRPLVLARPEPYLSSHVSAPSRLAEVLRGLRASHPEAQVLLFPRGPADRQRFRALGCLLPRRELDALSLYFHAALLLGAGCSMNREAALAGCPTLSLYPDALPAPDRWLIRQGRMRFTRNPKAALAWARGILDRRAAAPARAERVVRRATLAGLENPYRSLVEELERLTGERLRLPARLLAPPRL